MSQNASTIRSPWFLASLGLAAALLSLVVFTGEGRVTVDTRPVGSVEDIAALSERQDLNVLFILIDTLRAHRLSSYGYERPTSPTLDYLANTGARFAQHLAQSTWTKTSMVSLWTGHYPARTGVLRFPHATPDEAIMPAEVLRDAGFRTGGIWRNGWVSSNFGFAQGFELYHRPNARLQNPELRRETPNATLEGSDEEAIDMAIEFLRVQRANRWFLYVHLMDVHQYLFDEESAVFGSDYSDLYDNSILHEDNLVSHLITFLASQGLLERTLVIVGSDHGEAFRERGIEGHARHVYRESTEVPWILSFPFKLEPGIVISTPSENVDLWPTVFEILGLPATPDTDGRSLLPELLASGRGRTLPQDTTPSIAHLDRSWARVELDSEPAISVSDDRYRFVYAINASGSTNQELFDRQEDPKETQDLVHERPEVAARMLEFAENYIEHSSPAWDIETPAVEVDQMELNQLRALGYVVP